MCTYLAFSNGQEGLVAFSAHPLLRRSRLVHLELQQNCTTLQA